VKTIRVDITSEPKLASDQKKLEAIRDALTDLKNVGVKQGDEDVVVVSFDVEANGLGEAVSKGEQQLDDALKAAGVEMRYLAAGATGWAG
jgi:hypothetical protein